jgi:hypothetical protein
MRVYRERLGVPFSWWLGGAGCVIIFGTLTWAGFTVVIGLLVYLALGALVAFALLRWSRVVIALTPDGLTAGSRRLPFAEISAVSALDEEQTTVLRGPRSDPAAYMVVRPYLHRSVYIEVTGQPYWLIGTRHPTELAAAIEQAMTAGATRASTGLGSGVQ